MFRVIRRRWTPRANGSSASSRSVLPLNALFVTNTSTTVAGRFSSAGSWTSGT